MTTTDPLSPEATSDLPGFAPVERPTRAPRPATSSTSSSTPGTSDYPEGPGPSPSTPDPSGPPMSANSTPNKATRRKRPWSRTPGGSSPASTARPPVTAELAAGYAGLAATGVQALGLFLNARMAPGTGLWLPTMQETEAIAMPLGRIAARHAPMDTGTATDLSDAAEAVVGAVGYGVRNMTMAAAMRGGDTPQPAPPPTSAEAADPGPPPHATGPGSAFLAPDGLGLDGDPVSDLEDGPTNPAGEPIGSGFHDVFPPGFGG